MYHRETRDSVTKNGGNVTEMVVDLLVLFSWRISDSTISMQANNLLSKYL
jgi:hypothetical protein